MMLSAAHHDDMAARRLALTALDRTMLVEAGAGSGKTSILAGRVVALLAAGRPPGSIAAITFTELAASELRERIAAFLDELIEGRVRPDLEPAFGTGCTGEQRQTLAAARGDLDQLTCCTIHSFCQTLLTPYPVEADMDPGAAVMDRVAADVLFSEVFEDGLRERLSVAQDPDDLLVAMFLADPSATRGLLEGISEKLRGRPDLCFPPELSGTEQLGTLRASVVAFRHFLDGAPCQEAGTEAIVAGLEALSADLQFGSGPSSATLIRMLRLSAPACCARQDGGFRAYQAKGRWKVAAKASRSIAEAERLNDQATECYAACVEAHAAVRAWAATRVLSRLGEDCRAVVERFAQAKRDRAQLDFDDLMLKSRDLLARRADVRRALNKRFACILVDEFQDTDPTQCEILWRLAGNPPEGVADAPWDAWDLVPGSLFLVGDPKQAIYRFRGADVASYLGVRDLLRAKDRDSVVGVAQNFRSVHGILEWVNRHFEGPLRAEGQPGFAHLFAAAGRSDAASVACFDIEVESTKADVIRDAEAEAVAALCDRLIGSLEIRGRDGARLCAPDDIALLAPSGTDLWRYERALEERGIAVSTQAGKGFFRRQEVQDLIALTRILADGRDTLALGAFEMMSAGLHAVGSWPRLGGDEAMLGRSEPERDGPDRATFEAQAAAIVANTHVVTRTTPHLAEAGDEPVAEAEVLADDAGAFGSDARVNAARVRGSRTRGLILHKLLEEVLTGERPESGPALSERAVELAAELAGKAAETLDCAELATSVLRGLAVPEVAAVRHALIPECWVSASRCDGRAENVVIGIADAVALDRDGGIGLVIDWKSDVAPEPKTVSRYRGQVRSYLDATGAPEGLIVFLTTGQVERVRSIDAE